MYGEKALPEERVRLIAKELSPLNDSQIRDVVDDIVANHNYAPTLKEFLKYAEVPLKRNYDEQEAAFDHQVRERRLKGESCWACDDIGTISAIDKTNPHATTFSFGCPDDKCMAREFKAKNIARWDGRFENRFEPCFVLKGKTTFQQWRDMHAPNVEPGPVQDWEWPKLINKLSQAQDDDPPGAG
jgi:hypothetical protein